MDDATRKALCGLLPFAPGSSLPFTPEAFQSVEEAFRPVFHMRGFTQKTIAYMASRAQSGTLTTDAMAQCLKDGAIAGWDNLIDFGTEEPVPFGLDTIDGFPLQLVQALYLRASELSGLTEAEKEGLESAPQPSSESSSNPAHVAGEALS